MGVWKGGKATGVHFFQHVFTLASLLLATTTEMIRGEENSGEPFWTRQRIPFLYAHNFRSRDVDGGWMRILVDIQKLFLFYSLRANVPIFVFKQTWWSSAATLCFYIVPECVKLVYVPCWPGLGVSRLILAGDILFWTVPIGGIICLPFSKIMDELH